jgi:hypothetical protein
VEGELCLGEWNNNAKDGMEIYVFNKCNNIFTGTSQFNNMKRKYISLAYYFGPVGVLSNSKTENSQEVGRRGREKEREKNCTWW